MRLKAVAAAVVTALLCTAATRADDKGDFKRARKADTITEYQKFLAKHPNSPLAPEVALRMAELDWDVATNRDDLPSYEAYRSRHPSGVNGGREALNSDVSLLN